LISRQNEEEAIFENNPIKSFVLIEVTLLSVKTDEQPKLEALGK
jgi:hypothetical protein